MPQEIEQLILSNPQVLRWGFSRAYKLDKLSLLSDPDDGMTTATIDAESIDFSYTEVDDETVQNVVYASPSLKKLLLTQTFVSQPKIYCRYMEELDVSGTPITGEMLSTIVEHCPLLTRLVAEKCYSVSNLTSFRSDSLRELNLAANPIENESVHSIVEKCPGLIKLNLSGCNQLTVIDFTKHASLKQIIFARCMSLRSLSFEKTGCPCVNYIDVLACSQLSSIHLKGYGRVICEPAHVKVRVQEGEVHVVADRKYQQTLGIMAEMFHGQ